MFILLATDHKMVRSLLRLEVIFNDSAFEELILEFYLVLFEFCNICPQMLVAWSMVFYGLQHYWFSDN